MYLIGGCQKLTSQLSYNVGFISSMHSQVAVEPKSFRIAIEKQPGASS